VNSDSDDDDSNSDLSLHSDLSSNDFDDNEITDNVIAMKPNVSPHLSEYELLRESNIIRNNEKLIALNIAPLVVKKLQQTRKPKATVTPRPKISRERKVKFVKQQVAADTHDNGSDSSSDDSEIDLKVPTWNYLTLTDAQREILPPYVLKKVGESFVDR
jgi:type V secretory pathway adhesin AidA